MAEKTVDIRKGLRCSANAVPKCAVQSVTVFQTQVLADQNVLIGNNSFPQGDMEVELWELSPCPSIDIEPTSPIAALLASIATSHRVTINPVHQAGHFDRARSRLSVARKNNGVVVVSNLPNGLASSGLLSRQAARGYGDPLTWAMNGH